MSAERKTEIHRRRHRRDKLVKLRAKLAAASSKEERKKIVEKIRRISPFALIPEK